jgi:stage II sporulation protein GA (sporulation sigma-E factor processing peptidase)
MRVVYVDVLFMTNLAVNYLLLVLTARLGGIYAGRLRILCGAALGALCAVALYFPALPGLLAFGTKAVLCAAIVAVAFRREGRGAWLRLCLIFLAVSFAFAGGVMAVAAFSGGAAQVSNGVPYFDVSLKLLLCAVAGVYAVLGLVMRPGTFSPRRKTVKLRLFSGDREIAVKGFVDSGNLLRDPLSGQPIIVASPSVAEGLFPPEETVLIRRGAAGDALAAFTDLAARTPGRYRLAPCRTAEGGGMMVCAKMDKILVDGQPAGGNLVGFAGQELQIQDGCRAIVGV